ncbi:run domain Beclin-1 interacting and cysteine-rich containing -like [Brachionus plicatilis]|uniref:Run domain Beclin-1 interacting and cysteine-rich containing-like n=1 Tax=Brachionus plicatilis TaxID=10195 RepID=A0A3M7T7Y3_BRAPC|nr:run domain Beclin-1 interacting and cysteine-rich containing -like [Brachionus plicatilis]
MMLEIEDFSRFQRKLKLLKALKTTFESLLFDRGSNSFGHFNFNGNFCLFCQYIKEILIDGIKASQEEKKCEIFWDLTVSAFFDEHNNKENNFPMIEFKRVYKTLNLDAPNNLLFDWIYKSLRNKTFLDQFTYILKFHEKFTNVFEEAAFLIDDLFLADFVVYIKAYENNDSKFLRNCKIDLVKLLKSQIELENNSQIIGFGEPSTNHFPTSLSNLKSNSIEKIHHKHRRINSYPIIQHKSPNLERNSKININANQYFDPKRIDVQEENNLKSIEQNSYLKDKIESPNAARNHFESNNGANVLDFINQLHLHSECSSLDKENSHFLMADLVITSNELIKTNSLLQEKSNKTSSPIDIYMNVPKLSEEKISRSRSLSRSINISKSFNQRSLSFSELYSLDDSRISEMVRQFKGFRVNELVKSFQHDVSNVSSLFFESKKNHSVSSSPIFNNSISFEQSNQITEEGFDFVEAKSSRIRKFSWETKDILDSASFIAFTIIKSFLNLTKIKAPRLELFEYFLKNLEYNELIRDYYFSRARILKTRKELSDTLSASSIYLSHNEVHAKAVGPSAESFILIDSENNLSSYSKIRDIALNTLDTRGEDYSNSSFNLNSSRIIGDDSWAPVREQLIIKKVPKISRNELIRSQNYRCADCGLKIKDTSKQLKSFNYCEYFCKYFCRYCHINETSYIPAEIIFSLNFKIDFQVCKKAKKFLSSIFKEPVFSLENLNPSLFQGKYSLFNRMKILRTKLYMSGQYITTCRYADKINNEIDTKFQNEKFIFENTDVFSFYLMFKLKKEDFIDDLRYLSHRVINHIKTCKLCSQRSHICGICRKNELIFPFDIETVDKCPNCFSCYHKKCIIKVKECPKCIRLKSRAQK